MFYQSLLGLSLLVLTCASPTLGAIEEPASTTLHSPPTSAPQPLLRLHRHRYHRQQRQVDLVTQAAGGDPRTQVSISTPGSVLSAIDRSLLLPSTSPGIILPPTSPVTLLPTGSALAPTSVATLPATDPALTPTGPVVPPPSPVSPSTGPALPPTGLASPSTGPRTLPPAGPTLRSTSPVMLSSTGSAILLPTSPMVLSSTVPTQSVFPTSNRDASVTTAQSQTPEPIDSIDPNIGNNDPLADLDPGVDAQDQTDPDVTIAPSLTAGNSFTTTATPFVDSSTSFSFDSFMPTDLPLVIIPVGMPQPSSMSQFLTTSTATFPTVTATPTLVTSSASPSQLSLSSQSSTAPLLASSAYSSSTLDSISSESVSVLLPTGGPSIASNRDLNHPNPASSSPQVERSKKAAVLAGFLILGTLGAVGVALLCSYCGLFRCCRRPKDRGISSADRIAEEGLNGEEPPKLVRVNLNEKWSIVPGSPPTAEVEDFVDTLQRDAHVHTLSCSTCPPDSLNGVRGGVPGGGNYEPGQLTPGWVFPNHLQLANLALQPQGENATTHTATPLAFTNVHLQGPETPSQSAASPAAAPVEEQTGAPGSEATPTEKAPIPGRVSTSGDSYMTCDSASKYSMASGRRASGGVDSVVGSSDSDKDSGTTGAETERPSTPEASHSSSTTTSPSLLMTPQQPVGVPDVALLASPLSVGVRGGLGIAMPGEVGAESATAGEAEWDVVAAYSYVAREEAKGTSVGELVLRSRELPSALGQKGPSQKAVRKKNVRERRATGAGIAGKSRVVGPLSLGEKRILVVHGA